MQRIAFVIQVRPDRLDEYRGRHDPLPADLAAELTASGIRNYSLWLQPDGTEFGYLECDDWAAACEYLARSPVHEAWQRQMREFLITPNDPAAGGQPVRMLERAFLLE